MNTTSSKRSFCLVACLVLAGMAGCAKEPGAARPKTDDEVLRQMMAGITEGIEALGRDVEETAKAIGKTGLSGEEAREALAKLCDGHKPSVVDCSTIDADGIMVTVEPAAFRNLEGTDVSRHRASIELERTKEPVLSQVFMTAEKIQAIVFEWPIFTSEGILLGAVSAMFDADRFIGPLISKTVALPVYSGWVAQVDGRLLYSPDPSQKGRNVFKDPYYRDMRELVALGKKVAADRAGRGVFRRHGTGQAGFIERLCIWDTIDFHNAQWRVILVKKI